MELKKAAGGRYLLYRWLTVFMIDDDLLILHANMRHDVLMVHGSRSLQESPFNELKSYISNIEY